MPWKPEPPKRLRKRTRNKIVQMFDSFIARPRDHPRSDRIGRVIDIVVPGKLANFNGLIEDKERERAAIDNAWAAAATTRLDAWRHQTFAVAEHQIVWSQRIAQWLHTDLAWLYNSTPPDNMMWFSVRATRVESYGPCSSGPMRNLVGPVATFSSYEFASWVAGMQIQTSRWRKGFYSEAAEIVGESYDGTLSSRFAVLTRLWAHRVLHGETIAKERDVFEVRMSPALAHCDITYYFGGL